MRVASSWKEAKELQVALHEVTLQMEPSLSPRGDTGWPWARRNLGKAESDPYLNLPALIMSHFLAWDPAGRPRNGVLNILAFKEKMETKLFYNA